MNAVFFKNYLLPISEWFLKSLDFFLIQIKYLNEEKNNMLNSVKK